MDRSHSAEIEAVSVEIEVVYLNLKELKDFVVTVLPPTQQLGCRVLPAGKLRPNEDPPDAAKRILRQQTGIRDVFHAPLLVSMNRYPDRQSQGSTLSISFAILGPQPSGRKPLVTSCAVEDPAAPLGGSERPPHTAWGAAGPAP